MKNRKGQFSKVFVFVFSFIIILFAGFLVVKFVSSFTSNSEEVFEQKFYEQMDENYDSVLKTYGTQKVYKYKVSSRVEYVCFVSKKDCIDSLDMIDNISSTGKELMRQLFDNGDNVIVFDDEDVLSSKNIGEFTVKNEGCFCVKPGYANWFSILMENRLNTVVIDYIS